MGLFRRRRDDAVDPEERSPQLGVKYKDLAVMGSLLDAGARLDEPRHVLHFLYFASQEAAEAAAREAGARGWEAAAHPPVEDATDWRVVAERPDLVLSAEVVRDSTDVFEEIAARHGGDYDGWEASV